jgi:hypothetical protein
MAIIRSVPRTIKKKPDPVNHPEYEEEEDIKTFPPEGFTVWDKVVIQEGDLTVQVRCGGLLGSRLGFLVLIQAVLLCRSFWISGRPSTA